MCSVRCYLWRFFSRCLLVASSSIGCFLWARISDPNDVIAWNSPCAGVYESIPLNLTWVCADEVPPKWKSGEVPPCHPTVVALRFFASAVAYKDI